jgi:hypothetical protein
VKKTTHTLEEWVVVKVEYFGTTLNDKLVRLDPSERKSPVILLT